MKADAIPQELRDIVDQAAGKKHSDDGYVMTALAEVLTVHERELQQRIRIQRAVITQLNEALRRKNLQLDALHLVWCSGGCPSGVHRWQPPEALVTEEMVTELETQAKRLRSWYTTVGYRSQLASQEGSSEWLRGYAARAAAKTDIPVKRREVQELEKRKTWTQKVLIRLAKRASALLSSLRRYGKSSRSSSSART
jgi:hypothetical protein